MSLGRSGPGVRQVCEDLADGPWFGGERDPSDVAATRRALERKLLPHPRHEFGPGNLGGVVRAGLLLRVAAALRAVTVTPVPACHGIALLANVTRYDRLTARPVSGRPRLQPPT